MVVGSFISDSGKPPVKVVHMQEPTIGLSPASQAGAVTPVSAPRPPKLEQKSPGIAICHEVLLLIYECIPCRHCKSYSFIRDYWGDHIYTADYTTL